MGGFNYGHQRGAALLGAPALSLAKGYQEVQKRGCSRTQAKPPPAKAIKPKGGSGDRQSVGSTEHGHHPPGTAARQRHWEDRGATTAVIHQKKLLILSYFVYFLLRGEPNSS